MMSFDLRRIRLAKILSDLQVSNPDMKEEIEDAASYVEDLESDNQFLEHQLYIANAHVAAIKAFDEETNT